MIKLLRSGTYQLIETKNHVKILVIDEKDTFAWINIEDIGEILVTSHKKHRTDHILARSRYRLYEVKGEKHLTDLQHLELYVGDSIWQGYLLPTGLPNNVKKRNRIIPTQELITKTLH